MGTLPRLNPKTKENKSPHIVILGAGASLASFPNGDKFGKSLPLIGNFLRTVGLKEILDARNVNVEGNFEDFFDDLVTNKRDIEIQELIENKV